MTRQLYKRFIWSAVIILAILLVGTIGFWLIAGRQSPLLESLYMTVITVATIGYGEITDVSSWYGRVFTMTIALAGIGTLTYVLTNLTAMVVEGQLTKSFRRRRMEKRAARSRTHYIVCGAGEVASHVVNELHATKRPYVVVEADEQDIESTLERFQDATVIQGDATQDEILLKAGIKDAQGVFAVTGDDNVNLVVCLTAKQLNPNVRIVAQCSHDGHTEKMKRAGADAVVSPSRIGGMRMASEMIRPTVVSFLDTMLRDREKALRVEELAVPAGYVGKTISDLDLKKYRNISLLAVKRKEDWVYNPAGEYVVGHGDSLVFITDPDSLRKLRDVFDAG